MVVRDRGEGVVGGDHTAVGGRLRQEEKETSGCGCCIIA
jgi:hypothetical protein